MKILLVTEYFYPQSSGGTELYVYNLAQALQKLNHQAEVLSLLENAEKRINYQGITVHYIPFNQNFQTKVISGEQPADNINHFINKLQQIAPNIVHFHTLTTSISTYHIAAAKKIGFKTVLTSHIGAHTCIRGNLMHLGKHVCDGKVEQQKCLSCYLQYRGIPEPFNKLSAFVIRTTSFSKTLSKIVTNKQNELVQLKVNLNQLVVVCNWQHEVFVRNNFNLKNISLCRQAININKTKMVPKKDSAKLVIGFVGRITAIKGLHVLLNALKNATTENIELRVAAIPTQTQYYYEQKKQAKLLPNIIWRENILNEDIGDFLQKLDILCVPSQLPETGPFVIYEALSHGIPVLGSDLGGIAELITISKNGWLFPYQNYQYLGSLIASFIIQKREGKLLKDVEAINRPGEKLGEEMVQLYAKLICN